MAEDFRNWCYKTCSSQRACLARRRLEAKRHKDHGIPGLVGHLNWAALAHECGMKKDGQGE